MTWDLRFLFPFGLTFLIAVSLAEARPEPGPSDQAHYYPLQVGNEWKYKVTTGDMPVVVSRLAAIETLDGMPLARVDALIDDKVVVNEHVRVTEKGIFRHRYNGQELSPPLCLLKFPLKASDRWTGEYTYATEKTTYSCESKEETIEVKAGKFKALKVTLVLESGANKITVTNWFVKDVGIVKQTVDSPEIQLELEEYKLVKGEKKE